MIPQQLPVLIVGAGGGGLASSLLLSQQGIQALVIDRRADISWFPRARNINFRSIEIFRGLGLGKQVHAAGSRMSRMFRKETLACDEEEELLNPIELAADTDLAQLTPEPLVLYCPQ